MYRLENKSMDAYLPMRGSQGVGVTMTGLACLQAISLSIYPIHPIPSQILSKLWLLFYELQPLSYIGQRVLFVSTVPEHLIGGYFINKYLTFSRIEAIISTDSHISKTVKTNIKCTYVPQHLHCQPDEGSLYESQALQKQGVKITHVKECRFQFLASPDMTRHDRAIH